MKDQATDIVTFTLADHESIGSPTSHIIALELYRDSVTRPSLSALSEKINDLQSSNDVVADFELLDLVPLFQSTVEGYLLAVQSMWERGLRGMLVGRARRIPQAEKYIRALQRAKWSDKKQPDLHHYFHDLMGLPMKSFDAYSDLDLLQVFGSALRHGDGPAAQKLHERVPSLWWNWLGPSTRIEAGPFIIAIPADAPKHPNFADITLPEVVLEQMIQSAIWFWEDVEHIRCNSFSQKHPSVVEKLNGWKLDRPRRPQKRMWNPS